MKHKVLWAVGISAGLLLLLRGKSTAAAAAPATSSAGGVPAGVDTTPIGLASIYFDPGTTYDVNANVSSPSYGNTIN